MRRRLTLMAVGLALLSACASVPEGERVRSVAVWDLENLSVEASDNPDLGGLLAAEIIQAVQGAGDIQVVEREKLVAILEELKLGSTLADDATRLKVGRMTGAREMVFGGYMVVGPTMRIDLRRVDVESGRIIKTSKQIAPTSDLNGWRKAARDAAMELMR